MKIHTLEGDHVCSKRDFIIKGVHGEFYPNLETSQSQIVSKLTNEAAAERMEKDTHRIFRVCRDYTG